MKGSEEAAAGEDSASDPAAMLVKAKACFIMVVSPTLEQGITKLQRQLKCRSTNLDQSPASTSFTAAIISAGGHGLGSVVASGNFARTSSRVNRPE